MTFKCNCNRNSLQILQIRINVRNFNLIVPPQADAAFIRMHFVQRRIRFFFLFLIELTEQTIIGKQSTCSKQCSVSQFFY